MGGYAHMKMLNFIDIKMHPITVVPVPSKYQLLMLDSVTNERNEVQVSLTLSISSTPLPLPLLPPKTALESMVIYEMSLQFQAYLN